MVYSIRRVCEPGNQDAAAVGKREIGGLCVPRTGYESTKKAERISAQREISLECSWSSRCRLFELCSTFW